MSKMNKGNQRLQSSFYVAKNGNDGWSGRLPEPNAQKTDGPFATLVRARDAVREKKRHRGLKELITVMVRDGKYYFDQSLVFSSDDSGTNDYPITYTAYPNEKPILSGGRKVIGWKPYKDKILQADLPLAKGWKWKFRQLFLDGQRQVRARYPKYDPENPFYGGWAFMDGPAEEGSLTAFRYKLGTFKRHWSTPTEAEVNVFPYSSWLNNIIPIKSIDEERRIITLMHSATDFYRPHWFFECSFRAGNRFIVENVLEELDQPGEWCLDVELNAI